MICLIRPGNTYNGFRLLLFHPSYCWLSELASDAMPQILNNMHIPDVTVSSATISKIHINHVEKPTIQAKFLRDRGKRVLFSFRIEPQHLPKPFKKIASMMCSKCFLEISANLTEQPRVEINAKQGARVQLAGDVLLQFQGREELYNLINASTRLHVTLKPTIRHSRLYGDIALTNVDVKVYDLAVGGVLSKPIEKLVSFIVPRVLWPQVKKRIRFAWNRRGIQLPVLCGVELEHLSLSYIDRAAVINTDFRFDLPLFVRKFKLYLIQKSMTFRGIPTYVEI
ncbi:unnamed protein product [Haemonchus placei]|uniref:Lipid-binding serum glycoprotein C-terminal domain-containing protein n=1 Tax=Haemonchus placei TaxID=6290 RepID=A0A3P7Z1V1_HAEPC|nr:unnamed protein product [Haemonchus placei]